MTDETTTDSVKVIIVEDNLTYREALESGLRVADNVECMAAVHSSESALESIAGGSIPDVVLLDLELPGMGGLQAIPEFRKAIPGVDILILTQFDDRPKVVEAISRGASGYLLKTASISEILHGIQEVRAGGAPLNSRIARMVLTAFSHLAPKEESEKLTAREREILELLSQGYAKKQVAGELKLSYYTVDTHVKNIYEKLQVHNLAGAINKAARRGLF